MTADGGPAASSAPLVSLSSVPGDVPVQSVASIVLSIVRIDLKPVDAPDSESEGEGQASSADTDESQWVQVPVAAGTTVDLLGLPAVGGQQVGAADVVATAYKEIRLVCDGPATITLAEAVTLTGGIVIGDDEPLEQPLFIPSCEASGLKIKGGTFNVPAGGQGVATIDVSTDASIQSIDWNAQGFSMSPVMKIDG